MVLFCIVEWGRGLNTLIAIATGNRIANKLDGTFRQSRCIEHDAILVEHEATEVWFQFVSLNDIHYSYLVFTTLHGSCKRCHRVAFTHERYLEGFCLINLHHEVSASWLGNHAQRRSCEACIDLHARKGEARLFGILEADASNILDVWVVSRNYFPLYG